MISPVSIATPPFLLPGDERTAARFLNSSSHNSDHDHFVETDSYRPADPSQGQLKASERLWGRAFRTSGDVVFLLGVVCTALYVAIFVLIMQLEA